MKSEPNITRMDYLHMHGWWVRLYRGAGKDKVCHSKSFADASRGGKRKALARARRWRAAKLRELPSVRQVAPGYGYVKRAEIKRRVSYSDVFVAWVRIENGRCKITSVSVATWGVREAKRRAEAWLAREQRAVRKRLRG